MSVNYLLFILQAREFHQSAACLIKMDALQSQGFASQLVRGGLKWGMSSLTKRAEAKIQQEEPVSAKIKKQKMGRETEGVLPVFNIKVLCLKIQLESTSN